MRLHHCCVALGALALAAVAGAAQAQDFDYVLTVPNQTGVVAGTPYAGETLIYRVRADIATLSAYPSIAFFPAGGPGQCVTATTATVQVGAAAPVAFTAPAFFCSADGGGLTGIYFNNQDGPNHHTDSGVFPLTTSGSSVGPGNDHNLGMATGIAITGGTFTVTSDGTSLNTTTATNSAVAVAAAVPTMAEWAMILFGMILAGGAATLIQRRRSVSEV